MLPFVGVGSTGGVTIARATSAIPATSRGGASRSSLEELGGFRGVANVLAEDYVLGRKFEAAGYRVSVTSSGHEGIELLRHERAVQRHGQ